MRVLLIGNYAPDRQESMQRFANLLERGLQERGHEVRVISPSPLAGAKFTNRGLGKWLGYVDKFALFPSSLRKQVAWADVVHICDHSNAMYASSAENKPCVVTCHDMLAVRGALGEQTDCPASWTGHYLQRWILRGLKRATTVVAVSSATSADVERLVTPGAGKLTTILNGLNFAYAPVNGTAAVLLREVHGLDPRRPYLLHVGHNHPRKNKQGVIRIFGIAARENPELQLVLAGPPLTPELQELVKGIGAAERVMVAVKPRNEVLQALYSSALCLVFPSRFEGFGWPLAEAQACGCPVICSRCAPFEEVVGNTALVREADDEDGFAEDIRFLSTHAAERDNYIQQGLANARRFAPERMIDSYVDVYQRLVQR